MRTHQRIGAGWRCLDDGVVTSSPDAAPRLAVIGDSLTYMNGSGEAFVREALADAGVPDDKLYYYGVIGKRTTAADSAGKTTAQNIADARAQLGRVDQWLIALGTNDRNSASVSYIRTTIQTVRNLIGGDPVVWVGLSSKGAATAVDIQTNNIIQEELYTGDAYADWDARIRSIDGGADPSPYWNVNDAIHMPPAGYRERAKFYAEQIAAALARGGSGGSGPFDRAPDFEDTFTGPSIDSGKWNVWDSTYLGYDWGDIKAANCDIVDGKLRQRVTRKASPVTRGDRVRHWDTAYMVSHYRQTYGRWEMRAKIPTVANQSQGLWPAFWLRNNPSNGEIDIMESWGGPTKNRSRGANLESTSAFALHQNTSGSGESYNHPIEWRANPGQASYNTSGDYHVWTCDYMPDYLRIYFDGVMVADCRPGGDKHPLANASHSTRDLSWLWGPTFTAPWEIRVNFQMGDNYWSSDTDPATGALTGNVPAEYLIDYIRAWEYTP